MAVSGNRRRAARTPRRVRVDFGTDSLDHAAFTGDVSLCGLFLITNNPLPLGTRIHMRLQTAGRACYMEGLVVRHSLVPRELRSMQQQGMGVRFLKPEEVIDGTAHECARPGALRVECESGAALKGIVDNQLAHGHVMVPAGAAVPAFGSVVDFELRLSFVSPVQVVVGKGRVVQVFDAPGGSPAKQWVVVEAEDPAALRAAMKRATSAA